MKAEIIRQAKKYLENKNLSIKIIKPRKFAKVSQELNLDFDELLKTIKQKVEDGEAVTSDQE
jgi:hypothetical protein